jgi:hypothetical protein
VTVTAENTVPLLHRQAGLICPKCGTAPDWYNDVPLRAFCWGGKDGHPEHAEWSKVVPAPYNPYLRPYLGSKVTP